ncbi:MAG: hypothetical protein KBD53_10590 [Candidatus Omnitrophica bacterium]|nr:hypothetical protein [Candidatus Omnitrophota bacterium]
MFSQDHLRNKFTRKFISCLIIFTFSLGILFPSNISFAQSIPPTILNLPIPGTLIASTANFQPVLMKGLNLTPTDPLDIKFMFDQGENELSERELKQEADKIIRYFIAALAIPKESLWVNLSPYERDRITPDVLGQTEMGRDLLAQDYLLKQLTASLMNPEDALGQKFWQKVYAKAQQQFGTTDVPVNTFNKIWIVPEEAKVYEHSGGVFLVDNHLKVMLEEDYLALEANRGRTNHGLGDVKEEDMDITSGVSSEIVREILIPEIEREVNEGKLFANLRQIYNAMLLATWYKDSLKAVSFGEGYFDQGKIKGVEVDDKQIIQKIYDQYVASFQKGVFNYIKEDYDEATQDIVPRKYFSGGAALNEAELNTDVSKKDVDRAILSMISPFIILGAFSAADSMTQDKGANLQDLNNLADSTVVIDSTSASNNSSMTDSLNAKRDSIARSELAKIEEQEKQWEDQRNNLQDSLQELKGQLAHYEEALVPVKWQINAKKDNNLQEFELSMNFLPRYDWRVKTSFSSGLLGGGLLGPKLSNSYQRLGINFSNNGFLNSQWETNLGHTHLTSVKIENMPSDTNISRYFPQPGKKIEWDYWAVRSYLRLVKTMRVANNMAFALYGSADAWGMFDDRRMIHSMLGKVDANLGLNMVEYFNENKRLRVFSQLNFLGGDKDSYRSGEEIFLRSFLGGMDYTNISDDRTWSIGLTGDLGRTKYEFNTDFNLLMNKWLFSSDLKYVLSRHHFFPHSYTINGRVAYQPFNSTNINLEFYREELKYPLAGVEHNYGLKLGFNFSLSSPRSILDMRGKSSYSQNFGQNIYGEFPFEESAIVAKRNFSRLGDDDIMDPVWNPHTPERIFGKMMNILLNENTNYGDFLKNLKVNSTDGLLQVLRALSYMGYKYNYDTTKNKIKKSPEELYAAIRESFMRNGEEIPAAVCQQIAALGAHIANNFKSELGTEAEESTVMAFDTDGTVALHSVTLVNTREYGFVIVDGPWIFPTFRKDHNEALNFYQELQNLFSLYHTITDTEENGSLIDIIPSTEGGILVEGLTGRPFNMTNKKQDDILELTNNVLLGKPYLFFNGLELNDKDYIKKSKIEDGINKVQSQITGLNFKLQMTEQFKRIIQNSLQEDQSQGKGEGVSSSAEKILVKSASGDSLNISSPKDKKLDENNFVLMGLKLQLSMLEKDIAYMRKKIAEENVYINSLIYGSMAARAWEDYKNELEDLFVKKPLNDLNGEIKKKLEKSRKVNKAKKKNVDNSMLTNPGGIDLNPEIGAITVDSEQKFEWHIDPNYKPFDNISIDGLMHQIIIINLVPLQTIPLILGLSDDDQEMGKLASKASKADYISLDEAVLVSKKNMLY